jgi:hypothetical protein
MIELAPSILSADFARLGEEAQAAVATAEPPSSMPTSWTAISSPILRSARQ